MIWRLKQLGNCFVKLLQKICLHRKLRYVADAWDYEYICCLCDKRWFLEVPKLKRCFYWNGWREGWYTLDGKGGVFEDEKTS